MKKVIMAVFIFSLIALPLFAQAANPCTKAGLDANNNAASTLPQCVNQIYIWSLGLAALLALLMTILGSYTYMTAAGNAERASSGISYIWGAVIGLVLLFTAYLLLNTINPDLVNFNFKSYTELNQTTPSTPPKTR